MLINLLARFEGVVHKVAVRCPSGIKLDGRVIPLRQGCRSGDGARCRGNAIGPSRSRGTCSLIEPLQLALPADSREGRPVCDRRRLVRRHLREQSWLRSRRSWVPLPFGPYIAACIAAGKSSRRHECPGMSHRTRICLLFLLEPLGRRSPYSRGAADVEVTLDASIVGVGAVGSAVIHSLWACSALRGSVALIDNDPKGLDATNLNRYPVFGQDSVGHPKATAAAQTLSDSSIQWLPHDSAIESFRLATPRVVSAVDRNTALQPFKTNTPHEFSPAQRPISEPRSSVADRRVSGLASDASTSLKNLLRIMNCGRG